MNCSPLSQAQLNKSQKDQYSPFCKDFECFVNVLVHVLYFVAFLVPGLLAPLLLLCMCILQSNIKSHATHVSPLCLSQ